MKKRWHYLLPTLGAMYIVGLAWFARSRLGEDWRPTILLLSAAALVTLSVVTPWYEARVRRKIAELPPKLVAELSAAEEGFREFIEDRPRSNERTDWHWRLTDSIGGLSMTLHPPLLYSWWRYRTLQGDTPVDGWAVSLMAIGCAVALAVRHWRLRTYRCPRCQAAPQRLAGERIRLACRYCGITWQLGKPVFSDPTGRQPAT